MQYPFSCIFSTAIKHTMQMNIVQYILMFSMATRVSNILIGDSKSTSQGAYIYIQLADLRTGASMICLTLVKAINHTLF